ncbi:MAG: hypothetical protein L0154_18260 [Chloroflexi bacterium]|nr:hypothetical protein [Chloroflexota bacterium]
MTQDIQQNPALKDLAVLVGDWDMELSNASFLPDSSATLPGRASFEWLEQGAFVILRQGSEQSGAPSSKWIIGRDDSTGTYKLLYFDSRGVSRIYTMSFDGRVWKKWREASGFHQRFTGTFSDDGNRITGSWEMSSDGTNWEHDFDLTYTRVG